MHLQDAPFPSAGFRTIRAGCKLAYEAREPATLMLLFRPTSNPQQVLVEERLAFGNGMPVEEFTDLFGNVVYRTTLMPGLNEYHHDALFQVGAQAAPREQSTAFISAERLPAELLRYTLPSRYCDSDRLAAFAQSEFGHLSPGLEQVNAVCEWTHRHLAYRYGCGNPLHAASEVIAGGGGVCRDFAHVMIALCRALDLPARYVAGHVPYLGVAEGDVGVDFHAYCEVFLGGSWHTFDARFNQPRPGRIKIAHGLDAVDAAFATIYGDAVQTQFRVWSYEVDHAHKQLNQPVALSGDGEGSIIVHDPGAMAVQRR
jgi:transglutaminase-like putative cysteine protease